jgi:hypothetical protein
MGQKYRLPDAQTIAEVYALQPLKMWRFRNRRSIWRYLNAKEPGEPGSMLLLCAAGLTT